MPNPNVAKPAATLVNVWISPTLEADYIRRGVFPHLRIKDAKMKNNYQGLFEVPMEEARTIYEDSRVQRNVSRDKAHRGVTIAYCALENRLRTSVADRKEARRGIWDDPGMDEMMKRFAITPARFEVGDKVLHFDDDDESAEVTVIKGYGLHSGLDANGAYVNDKGQRIGYMFGYVIRIDGYANDYVVKACRLTRDDCKPAHLRLVWSAPGAGQLRS